MHRNLKSFTAICLLFAGGCAFDESFSSDKFDRIDRESNLGRDDYYDLHRKPSKNLNLALDKEKIKEPPIPELAQVLAAPRPPKVGDSKLVSITITDDVPLKDVLIELARLADVDLELDSGIEGGISFRAKEKPFPEVIERICNLAQLRYSMNDGVLKIERDTPSVKNYTVDFINFVRDSTSSTSVSTNVLSGGGGGGGGGAGGSGGGGSITSGTTSSITSKNESDIWTAIETSMKQILSGGEDASGAAAGAQCKSADACAGKPFYVINRQAGIITVSANSPQHKMIKKYLDELSRNASSQVLIEAKLVEVALDKEYSTGIDWTNFAQGKVNEFKFNAPAPNFTNGLTYSLTGFTGGDWNLGAAVKMAEKFGTTRTLSSPRLHAINNQASVLTFAKNAVFFEVAVQGGSTSTGNGSTSSTDPSITSTRREIPIGIIMSILPSINLETNEVTLNVKPTLSRQIDKIDDPGSALVNAIIKKTNPTATTFDNKIPVIEVRELDSIMKIESGQVMIIGGLMEDIATNTDTGVPWASEVPIVGNAFKSVSKTNQKKELIIFIKATIVDSAGNNSVAAADELIYKKFFDDPRPLTF